MSKKVCVLNYGSGNVKSVHNMLLHMGVEAVISNDSIDIRNATHLILPGVSAFGTAMDKIRALIPMDVVSHEVHQAKKPFLGICVGMQVLATKGYEFGEHEGLGWIEGEVKKLQVNDLPLPHVGWNEVDTNDKSSLFNGFEQKPDFYFVHSYVFHPKNLDHKLGETDYGQRFVSVIQKDNIFGVQFHPEKSQKMGQKLMTNFLSL